VHVRYVPFESKASAPPRHRFAARNIKRLGLLLASLGDQWQARGGRAALSELSTRIASYLRTRFMTARSKSIAALGNIKLPRPTTIAALRFPILRAKGTLFVGYADVDLDLGQSFRNLISAILDRKLTFRVYPLKAGVESRITSSFIPRLYDSFHIYDINVIEISTDQIANVSASLGLRGDNYNVLRTYWDLPQAPSEWKPMLSAIHEIWTPNEFARSAFLGIFSGPIRIIPPYICVDPLDANMGRPTFGLLPGRFYFLSTFDYNSSFYRNNPMSTVAAFRDAFPLLTENVGLVLESTGADRRFADIESEIERHVKRDPRIVAIDEAMPRSRLLGLIRACDCYVSLHRAEGLGLAMAEAMALGKAVIGTNFSGSTDFLTEETGFPIGYDLRRVEPHEYYWSRGQVWAEPDHAAAVDAFRRVYADPHLRTERGQNGQAIMRNRYGKEFVGASVERRICEIAESRSNRRRNHSADEL
jgi:glycosyltransferase involved in cell wall biosynthesis